MSALAADVAAPPAPGSSAGPLSARLIAHAMAPLAPPRRQAFEQALRALQSTGADDLEREIAHALTAAGKSLDHCLADLDAFNNLGPEVENDAWYDEPMAFTSMHLDALLPGFSQRRHLCTRAQALTHASAAACMAAAKCRAWGLRSTSVNRQSGRASARSADRRPLPLPTSRMHAAALAWVRAWALSLIHI